MDVGCVLGWIWRWRWLGKIDLLIGNPTGSASRSVADPGVVNVPTGFPCLTGSLVLARC